MPSESNAVLSALQLAPLRDARAPSRLKIRYVARRVPGSTPTLAPTSVNSSVTGPSSLSSSFQSAPSDSCRLRMNATVAAASLTSITRPSCSEVVQLIRGFP